MKKIIIILLGILLVGTVLAGTVTIELMNAVFTPEPVSEPIRFNGTITFDCGKERMSIFLDEPNMDIDDDFEEEVKHICQKQVSNVVDWTGRKYKKVTIGNETYRSFNEEKLNEMKERAEVVEEEVFPS